MESLLAKKITIMAFAEAVPPLESSSDHQQVELHTENPKDVLNHSKKDVLEHSQEIFQAIGVIYGEVSLSKDSNNTISIGRYQYPLFYVPRKRRVFDALSKEIEATGNHTQRLLVYPGAIHFPQKEKPHQISFHLVGFDKGQEEDLFSRELKDLEFKLSGLWQFIPVCPVPCISIFRNFNHQRLEYLKQFDPATKVKYMKANHLPVLWKDALVKPFRFNPKADKDQGYPMFVSIKAKFIPQRNVFGFDSLLSLPQETPPRFLRVSKKDKAAAQQSSAKNDSRKKPDDQNRLEKA